VRERWATPHCEISGVGTETAALLRNTSNASGTSGEGGGARHVGKVGCVTTSTPYRAPALPAVAGRA
jgi:hypothetical protein